MIYIYICEDIACNKVMILMCLIRYTWKKKLSPNNMHRLLAVLYLIFPCCVYDSAFDGKFQEILAAIWEMAYPLRNIYILFIYQILHIFVCWLSTYIVPLHTIKLRDQQCNTKREVWRSNIRGGFTVHRWIPHTGASDAEFWCFLWSPPE